MYNRNPLHSISVLSWSISVGLVLIFELRDHMRTMYSKLTQLNFLGKLLLVGKWAKIAPKWPIVSICPLHSISFRIGSLLLLIFWHYAWSWGTISTPNWQPIFFWKICTCLKVGQKAQNSPICPYVRYYSIFLKIGKLVFFYILQEAEGP